MKTYLTLAVILLVIAIGAIGYVKGRSDGRVQQLKDSLTAYQNREKVERDVSQLDGPALCRELGGLPDDCEQLRRMDETPTGP
jgi:hypothetical protein